MPAKKMSTSQGNKKNSKEAKNGTKKVNLNQSVDTAAAAAVQSKENRDKELASLTNKNVALLESLEISQKNYHTAESMAKDALNKQMALNQEILQKDKALHKYKIALFNQTKSKKVTSQEFHHDKKSEKAVKELEAQLENQQRIMNVLNNELMEKSKFFAGANQWNLKTSKEMEKLLEENQALKKKKGVGSDVPEKLQTLEKTIRDLQIELAKAKNTNEGLAIHIFGLEAQNAEIPKLQNKIRAMELQFATERKNSTGFNYNNSMASFSPSFSTNCIAQPRDNIMPPAANDHQTKNMNQMMQMMKHMADEITKLKEKHGND